MNNMSEIRTLDKNEIPERLFEIPEPPKKLYIRGQMPKANAKFLCVVGSRKYTPYGKEVCQKLIAGLRGYNIVIVSGLALGIDGIAHTAALDSGLTTIAVPGSGLSDKVLYPSTHKNLAKKIIESGGALLSEFEPEFRATPYSFPQRNRIMTGLSHAILVIEAEIKSGTLITSRLGTEYNRDVCAVPGSVFSKNSEGCHMLMRLGATPITKSENILEVLGFEQKQEELPFEEKYKDCSEQELKVVELLKNPQTRDELIRDLKLSAQEANSLLMIMEIKSLVKESGGELYLA